MQTGNRTWLVVGAALALAGVAQAYPKKGKPKLVDLAPMVTSLHGANMEQAEKAAEQLGTEPDPAAHEALLDALAMGLPPAVAVPAIVALSQHPAPPDVASLRRYAQHRNPAVRGAAYAALAMYPDPAAHAAVVLGLHDTVGIVRGAAAEAAAKGRVRESLDTLFELLDRGEESAARSLAAMADPDLARRIADQHGKAPDPILAQALGLVLKRPEFGPDPARVDLVRALAKIQDQAATNALVDYVEATPKNPPRPSREEASKVVQARGGSK
jgi:HEAT repeat protein